MQRAVPWRTAVSLINDHSQDITAPVQYLKGVGPHKAALLARLGIATIQDLLLTLPARYEDRRSSAKIVTLKPEQTIAVIGKVVVAEVVQPSRRNPRLRIFQVAISDGSGVLKGKWFNQAFLQRVFKPGQSVVLYGTVRPDYYGAGLEIMNPEYEILDDGDDVPETGSEQVHTGRIVPVYRLTEGLSQKQMRAMVHTALALYGKTIQENPARPDASAPCASGRRRLQRQCTFRLRLHCSTILTALQPRRITVFRLMNCLPSRSDWQP